MFELNAEITWFVNNIQFRRKVF